MSTRDFLAEADTFLAASSSASSSDISALYLASARRSLEAAKEIVRQTERVLGAREDEAVRVAKLRGAL